MIPRDTTVPRDDLPSLEDIAKNLGIAVSTVSRALRGRSGIHPSTRLKVVREAEAVGYIAPTKRSDPVPQESPRNILMLTIGASETPPGYHRGLSRAAVPSNYSLISHVCSMQESVGLLDPRYQPPLLRMGMVAGVVLIYQWPVEVVEELIRQCPVVSLVHHYQNLPVDVIGIDHVGGMFSLVEHLKLSGHRRIGFLGLETQISWARSRFAAFVEALLTLDLPFRYEDAVQIEGSHSLIRFSALDDKIFAQVVGKIQAGVKAWVCANDVIAQSLCERLLISGYRVPEDVAITGFHRRDFPSSGLLPLTTTEVDDELLGSAALRRLTYRLSHPGEAPRVVLMPCKFLRGSTTPDVSSE